MNKPKLIKLSDAIIVNHREITELYSEYAKSVGLTFSSLVILGIIWKEPECTQAVIIKKSNFPKQTVNTIIKSFIKQNIINDLVESNEDKRNKIVCFTENGKKWADNIMLKVKEAECLALDRLGEKNAQQLVEIINNYKNNLKFN